VISDVISKKWIADITSVDETSIEVQAVFNRALRAEGLDTLIEERNPDGVPWDPDNEQLPVLLVMSDNGPQMSSGTTREFMALRWLATHFGRPGTPTDQAWIESLFGHLKTEQPHLELIDDIDVLRTELEIRREHYNTVRLHAGIGYVTPDQEHRGQVFGVKNLRQISGLMVEWWGAVGRARVGGPCRFLGAGGSSCRSSGSRRSGGLRCV
jgi:transposase InsO family protein